MCWYCSIYWQNTGKAGCEPADTLDFFHLLSNIGGVTCHGGGCVAHGRHVGVSWRAHQRGNALSRVNVHVSCGRADKRAVTNCQISTPTFTHAFPQNASISHFRTHFCCYPALSLRNPTECAVSLWISCGWNIPSSSYLQLPWSLQNPHFPCKSIMGKQWHNGRVAVIQQSRHSGEVQNSV